MKFLVTVSVIIAGLLFGGLIYLNRPDHKYRLTVEVQTPDGVRSGSGVMAIYQGKISGPLPEAVAGVSMKGDAVYVDLGGGRNLIAILAHGENASYYDGMGFLAMNAFAAAGRKVPFKEVKLLSGTVQLYGNLIPTLVTFADVADPKTARVLAPPNIEAAFGAGYHLKRVTLEMLPAGLWPFDFGGPLGEPVTRGVERRLPWIAHRKSQGLGGRIDTHPSRFTVNVPYFVR
ncbi:hypothetical protein KMZ93_23305 [Bradyrhizobium sediminis]|uniref:Uncharacterized protein n=1 Tax=Bradyrhizobium sediminis TaxID=2840469 RepID=A0A975RXB8_9BRAD|nr:hypothetical protein [Bradyrhizobium sediminis]QWG22846.1 hypothetical protein KMZ93_23305 [Bradyrhizobium sediminis]